jgi:WD40 repeat protein
MPQRLRIFVSSPTDVPDERLRADLIVDKLSQDYSRFFTIDSYRWEHEAMLASKHFQDAIEPPSAFDIVVLILWSRLGTPLPEKTGEREYRGIDGRAPVTGTEWEYEEALKAARDKGAPDLLAFRNVSPAPIDPSDPEARARSNMQLDALDAFWTRHFADRSVFLAAYDKYRTLEEFAQRLEISLRKLIERRVRAIAAGELGTVPIWLGEPFRGLESYEYEHAPIFYGRDAAIMKATEQLAANARSGCAFLLVSGASGSGKSSLVKAGIVPRLMKPQRISGIGFLRRVIFQPTIAGTDVILGLAKVLTGTGEGEVGLSELIAPGMKAEQLATLLRTAASDPGYLFNLALGRMTDVERRSGRLLAFEQSKLILVIDQLEELFTATGISADDRHMFAKLLSGLARSGAVWVIATLRADFWYRMAEIPEFVALCGGLGRFDLLPASPAELAEIIRKPVQAAGLSFEVHPQTGLGLDSLLAEHATAAPGALPLLSFTLDELYKNARTREVTTLTHASYEALGGLEGAIANRAEEVYGNLPTAAQAALPRILRAITTITSVVDQTAVARAAPLTSFAEGGPARALVLSFVTARLLITASERGLPPVVRLAHEALISRWQRAQRQIAVDRRDLETRTLVERQFERWNQARGATRRSLMLRNPDLANALDLSKRWGDELDAPMRDFITRSTRRARLAQTLTATAAVLFGVIAAAAFYAEQAAVTARQKADDQTKIAERETANALRAKMDADDKAQLAAQAAEHARHAQKETEVRQVNLLAELTTSEELRGNWDTALRLGVHAARLGLAMDQNTASAPRAALATTAWRSPLRLTLSGHKEAAIAAVFSSDGRRVVTGSFDHTARIWDAENGNAIVVLRGHEDVVNSVAFSPDNKRIVTTSWDKTARIWNAATGAAVAVLRHEDLVISATFSPNGRQIVTASDTAAHIWDAATGSEIVALRGHDNGVTSASFSLDGRRIVTSSLDKTARIWDAANGKQSASLRHEDAVISASFSPNGRQIVTASEDGTARIWDAINGKQIFVLRGHEDMVASAVFSPDGRRIVTASRDQTPRIWDAANGKQFAVLRGHEIVAVLRGREDHESTAASAAFSPDGRLVVSVSDDRTARIWDAENGNQIAVLRSDEVTSAAFSRDSRHIVTASAEGAARVWDVKTSKEIGVLRSDAADFSPDGRRIITAAEDGIAHIWDVATRAEITVLRLGEQEYLKSASFRPDDRQIITLSWGKAARIWDAVNGKEIAVLRGHEGGLASAAFSSDGRRIVTASDDKTARIWDAANGTQIAVLRGHQRGVTSAVYSSDGRRIVTASGDQTVRVWDAANGTLVALIQSDDAVESALFNPAGTQIVTASNGSVGIWDATSRRQIFMLGGHEGRVESVKFSPDGTRIVTTASHDRAAHVWDAANGNEIAVLRGHENTVTSAAFSVDGTRIVTTSWDKTARIWDAANGKEIGVLRGHEREVGSAAFSADGRLLVTLSDDHAVRIWDVYFATMSTEGLINEVCKRRLLGLTTLDRDEMRLAGYSNSAPEIDVCAGLQ